jgi:hypothetical protein
MNDLKERKLREKYIRKKVLLKRREDAINP